MELEDLIRDPQWVGDVVRKGYVLRTVTAGDLVIHLTMKDGRWMAGPISVTFPRVKAG